MRVSLPLVACLVTLTKSPCISASSPSTTPIAGVDPSRRPQGAPVIEWVKHDRDWYQHALTGIQPPYPRSLYFLDNQGYWNTPFNRPGMNGRYDLRGWHQSSP